MYICLKLKIKNGKGAKFNPPFNKNLSFNSLMSSIDFLWGIKFLHVTIIVLIRLHFLSSPYIELKLFTISTGTLE